MEDLNLKDTGHAMDVDILGVATVKGVNIEISGSPEGVGIYLTHEEARIVGQWLVSAAKNGG